MDNNKSPFGLDHRALQQAKTISSFTKSVIMQNSIKFIRAFLIFLPLAIGIPFIGNAQVGINNTGNEPDASAMLDVVSTDKGMLTPRMSTEQREAIANPADGLIVYDTTTSTFWYYDNGEWNEVRNGSSALQSTDLTGNSIEPDFSCITTIGTNGQWSIGAGISGNYAYLISYNELYAVDISDLSNPTVVSSIPLDDLVDIGVFGDYAYILADTDDSHPYEGILYSVDVSDPNNMIILDQVATQNINAIHFTDEYVFTLEDESFFRIVNITDPNNLRVVTSKIVEGFPRDISASGNYVYVTSEDNLGLLEVYDISRIMNPSLITTLDISHESEKISISGNYAYVVNIPGGNLSIIDISNPSSPAILSTTNIGNGVESIFSTENYFYVIDFLSEQLEIFDVSDPQNPNLITSIPAGSNPRHLWVSGNTAYIAGNDFHIVQLACDYALGIDPITGEITNTPSPSIQRFTLNESTLELDISTGQLPQSVDLSELRKFGNINAGNQSTDQSNSNQANNGFTTTPWIYTNAIQATAERNATATLVTIGNDGVFGANDEIHLVTNGESRLTVNSDGNVGIGNLVIREESVDQGNSIRAGNGFTTVPWVYTNAIQATAERNATATLVTVGNDGVFGASDEIHLITNGNSRLQVTSNGRVGIGRTPTSQRLEVNGNASKNAAGDWLANSDARLKKNITNLDSESTLEKLLSLQGITYEWDDNRTSYERPEGIQYGFTAQNIQKVFPTLVEEDAEGYLQTAYGTYDAMYVEAIRALQEQIEALQAQNTALKQHNSSFEQRLTQLEALLQTTALSRE